MKFTLKNVCIAFVIIFFQGSILSQSFTEVMKLNRNNIPEIYLAELGRSVAVDGNFAIVGAPYGGANQKTCGTATIYEKNASTGNWDELKIIFPSDFSDDLGFGVSVDISGSYIIVGAARSLTSENIGESAYIFEQNSGGVNNWGEVKKLTSSDGLLGDFFGYCVSIDNELAVVGAYRNNGTGSVYIFSKDNGGINNWGELKKLSSINARNGDYFGFSVSIYGDNILIGSSGDNSSTGIDTGSAYIFSKDYNGLNNWGELKKITASDESDGFRYFGYSVSIDADKAIIGAYQRSGIETFDGGAYVFYKDQGGLENWGEVKLIVPSIREKNGHFGSSVSIKGDLVLVGAYGSENAFLFSRNDGGSDNWGEIQFFDNISGQDSDQFGISVALDDDILVGAPRDNEKGYRGGKFYFYQKDLNQSNQWNFTQDITVSSSAIEDHFGRGVSVDDDVIVVGSRENDGKGYLHIFRKDLNGIDQWGLEKEILIDDIITNTEEGYKVDVCGEYVVLSTYSQRRLSTQTDSKIFVYQQDVGGVKNWGLVKELTSSLGANANNVGASVSISNNIIIATGPSVNVGQGAAYIFEKDMGGINNWGLRKEIISSDISISDRFGTSADVLDDLVIVGVRDDDDNGVNSGSVYIFQKDLGSLNNWGELKKLLPNDGQAYDGFGHDISLSENHIIVSGNSSSYVFEKDFGGQNNWGQVKKLIPNISIPSSDFGVSVSIYEDKAIVGTELENGTGIAYIYKQDEGGLDNWGEFQVVESGKSFESNAYGIDVSIGSNIAVVGAHLDDDIGIDAGSVYVYADYCLKNRAINSDPIISNNYQAKQNIQSSGIVNSNEQVTYGATSICLTNGFEIKINSVFVADNVPCQ